MHCLRAEELRAERNLLFLTKRGLNNPTTKLNTIKLKADFHSNRFRKQEILRNKKIISLLFEKGNKVSDVYIKALWVEQQLPFDVPAQVLITVPKKLIPGAVQRNKIRRRLKELYRTHKRILYESLVKNEKQLALVIIYSKKQDVSFENLDKSLTSVLHKIIETYEKSDSASG